MAKVKRYNENGYVTSDDSNAGMKEAYDTAQTESRSESAPEPEKVATPTSFKQAFASARKAGDKTFEFNGKKFTTELAGSKTSAPTTQAPNSRSMDLPEATRTSAPAPKTPAPAPKSVAKNEGMSMTKMDPEKAQEAKRKGDQEVAFNKAMVRQQADRVVSDWKKRGSPLKSGGSTSSASRRGDGIAQRGKTRGRMC